MELTRKTKIKYWMNQKSKWKQKVQQWKRESTNSILQGMNEVKRWLVELVGTRKRLDVWRNVCEERRYEETSQNKTAIQQQHPEISSREEGKVVLTKYAPNKRLEQKSCPIQNDIFLTYKIFETFQIHWQAACFVYTSVYQYVYLEIRVVYTCID